MRRGIGFHAASRWAGWHVGVVAAMSLHSAGLTLDPLPAAALKAYRDMIVEVAPTNGAWNVPHWPAHWLEYNYAGPEASLDTAWRANHTYIEYELTHDGGAKVFRCIQSGLSGEVQPDWDRLMTLGDTTTDGSVAWAYVGRTGSFAGAGQSLALGEANSYYDVLACAHRAYDYLASIGDAQAPRFLKYTQYARGPWRDTYERPNAMRTPGWRRFPAGYYFDWRRSLDADVSAPEDLRLMRDGEGVPFSTAAEFKGESDGRWESMSREVAFAGLANLYAEKAGFARKLDSGSPHTQNPSGTLLECLVIWAESHLMEWRTQQSANPNGGRCAPFMFGLTAGFLATLAEWEQANGRDPNAYWPKRRWPTIAHGIGDVADFICNEMRVRPGFPFAGERVMVVDGGGYAVVRQDDGPNAEDLTAGLNLLFVPAYGFAGKWHAARGDFDAARHFFALGDHLFVSAVSVFKPIDKGKDWFQQLYHSGDYLRYRGEAQSETAPRIRIEIALANEDVEVSWPAGSTGWLLEQSDNLNEVLSGWVPVGPAMLQTNASTITARVVRSGAAQFYRLRGP